MSFLMIQAILLQSCTLIRRNNEFLKLVKLPSTSRLYSMYEKRQKDELRKEKKLTKKLVASLAEPHMPEYFKTRSIGWIDLKQKYDEELLFKERQPLQITLLDGKIVEGSTWETTPLDVAKDISSGLAADIYVAKINNELWDLERPLEADCKIELLKFDSPDAKAVFWMTTVYSLAEVLERLYGVDGGLLGNIGSTQAGFFVDIHLKDNTLTKSDKAIIEEEMSKVLSVRGKIERIEASKRDLLKLFAYNQFKLLTINDSQEDTIPLYRCGNFIDVCRSPLMRHNKKVKAYKVKIESVNKKQDGGLVQRIHGIFFPSDGDLKNFLKKRKL